MASTLTFYGVNNPIITVKCSLISNERFQAELAGYNEGVINIYKTIPSKNYNSQTRIWSFLIQDYNSLIYKLQQSDIKVKIDPIPSYIINCIKKKDQFVDINFDKIDPVLADTLLPFQIEGLRFGIEKNGRCLIADDMGLGKTFQALAIANYYKEDWPVLIVTTATMRTQWEETIAKFIPSVSVLEVQFMVTTKDYIGDSKILIISHDLMSRSIEKLLGRNFGILIIDESHILKNYKSKCYQSASKLANKAKRVILLSGTPALSRPSELYTQLNLLDKSFFSSFYKYCERYCDAKTTKFGLDCSGSSNLQELELLLAKKFMIRRTKEEVMQGLPNKKQEVVSLDTKLNELPEEDRKCLNVLGEQYMMQKGVQKQAALLSFYSETARIKIPAVCSYILPLLEKKEKFLIFAHHQCMLNALEDLVKNRNLKYIRIDGSTTTDQRKYFISKFQLDENYICAILSITACNAGITLTAAKLVLFAELHWNPSIISQAEARAHRIGQKDQVLVQYLLCNGTADDSIWPLLQEKQRTLKAVGLSKDSFEKVTFQKYSSSELCTSSKTSKTDIRDYLPPNKKAKMDEDSLNDGMDEILLQSFIDDSFNDGFDEVLCNIDF